MIIKIYFMVLETSKRFEVSHFCRVVVRVVHDASKYLVRCEANSRLELLPLHCDYPPSMARKKFFEH